MVGVWAATGAEAGWEAEAGLEFVVASPVPAEATVQLEGVPAMKSRTDARREAQACVRWRRVLM